MFKKQKPKSEVHRGFNPYKNILKFCQKYVQIMQNIV